MRSRIDKLLKVAAAQQHMTLVLGAWGCGVFKNSPIEVARWFAEALRTGPFCDVFERVAFAVLDRSEAGESIAPFHAAFG